VDVKVSKGSWYSPQREAPEEIFLKSGNRQALVILYDDHAVCISPTVLTVHGITNQRIRVNLQSGTSELIEEV
jgi:hypothetical protein